MALALALQVTVTVGGIAQARPAAGNPPSLVLGKFEDDYGGKFTITRDTFSQGSRAHYRIVTWDTAGKFLIAQNAEDHPSAANKWTRIDWMPFSGMAPFEWGFCFTAYDAVTETAAINAKPVDRANPMVGCNGFPFSRMKRVVGDSGRRGGG